MNKWLKRLLILLVVLAAGYYVAFMHSPSPSAEKAYVLDMDEVRKQANSLRGLKPRAIKVEKVAEFVFAEAMIMAGEPWQGSAMPVYSYQLQFPNKTIIVDTAMESVAGIPEFMVAMFDVEAYQRMSKAMSKASKIVITHEHSDHIGGILAHPELKQLLPQIHLTQEQLDHPDRMMPLSLPEGVFDDYQPLQYEAMHALAPGVVLIKAPGHTPGSQMVFVQLADGREVLLLGDVAWQTRNLDAVRERPLFMTTLIKENRSQVINQFQALHDLAVAEPELHILPGHDAVVYQSLVDAGVLTPGFASR